MTLSEQKLNPFPWYQQMRSSSPVHYDPSYDSWSVFRYDDVQRVLSDFASFSSRFQGAGSSIANPIGSSLIGTDPPRHRQLRSLVSQAFTPRAIAALEPRIDVITNELLDRVAQSGEIDVVKDLSYPLPVIVIAELLGIPPEDRDRFKYWSDAIVAGGTSENGEFDGFHHVQMEAGAYFMRVLAERKQNPKEDLISALLQAEIDGEKLSDLDLLGFCILLLVAGNETTTNLIGNAILCFDEQPGLYEELRSDPGLLPGAIEEVLRYRSPVQHMYRTVVEDMELGGQRLRKGQGMVAWIGSANRDEEQFPQADHFDIRRDPNRHIAFGHGIHFCLGAPLAKLEARVALGAMLERLPGLRMVPGARLEALEGAIVYGVKSLPVTFQATSLRRAA